MKIGGQILWNVKLVSETSQIYYLMGRRPMKDVLGNHLKDRLFHLVHWKSITLFLRRTSQESINLERKSYLDCSSDMHCTRGGIWKGDMLVADIEELETMDASEIYSKRLNAKEVTFPKEKGEFIFPVADGRRKFVEGIQELSTSTLIRGWPGGWAPQGRSPTGGSGLARVPNLRVCKHLCNLGWHTQGVKDELT